MADSAIFDLTQETAMTAAHRLVVQDTSAATASQSATFALMGGLEENAQTPVSSDITGAVGQLYLITQSSQSADINLTLPASAQDGERIGVHMVDGDDTYEVILKGAATVTINGGSAATEWSRLFIAGETVIFRCTSSTNWIVEYDGRIPCAASLVAAADQTLSVSNTWEGADFNTGEDDYDVGDLFDDTIDSNTGGFNIRRAGKYIVNCYSEFNTVEDTQVIGTSLKIDGTQEASLYRCNLYAASGSNVQRYGYVRNVNMTAAGTISLMIVKGWSAGNGNVKPVFSITEVL